MTIHEDLADVLLGTSQDAAAAAVLLPHGFDPVQFHSCDPEVELEGLINGGQYTAQSVARSTVHRSVIARALNDSRKGVLEAVAYNPTVGDHPDLVEQACGKAKMRKWKDLRDALAWALPAETLAQQIRERTFVATPMRERMWRAARRSPDVFWALWEAAGMDLRCSLLASVSHPGGPVGVGDALDTLEAVPDRERAMFHVVLNGYVGPVLAARLVTQERDWQVKVDIDHDAAMILARGSQWSANAVVGADICVDVARQALDKALPDGAMRMLQAARRNTYLLADTELVERAISVATVDGRMPSSAMHLLNVEDLSTDATLAVLRSGPKARQPLTEWLTCGSGRKPRAGELAAWLRDTGHPDTSADLDDRRGQRRTAGKHAVAALRILGEDAPDEFVVEVLEVCPAASLFSTPSGSNNTSDALAVAAPYLHRRLAGSPAAWQFVVDNATSSPLTVTELVDTALAVTTEQGPPTSVPRPLALCV